MSETLTTTIADSAQSAGPPPRLLAEDPGATSFPRASAEEDAAARVGAFAEQLVGMLGSATELLTIELGRRFGLYRTLHERGPMTASHLARGARIAPRYAREWLEQQAAAGIIAVDEPGASQHERRFRLPEHHVPVLVDETHPAHVAPVAGMLAGVALAFPELDRAPLGRRGGLRPGRRARYREPVLALLKHRLSATGRPAPRAEQRGCRGRTIGRGIRVPPPAPSHPEPRRPAPCGHGSG